MTYVLKWTGGDCGDGKIWFVSVKRGLDARGRRMTEATFSASLADAKRFTSREKAQAWNNWGEGMVTPVSLEAAQREATSAAVG